MVKLILALKTGGGGGGGGTDSTPNQFTFNDVSGAILSTVYTSNIITITGIDTASPISIVGGSYSKNGGTYTSGLGTVVNGDTIVVRGTSSGVNSTGVDVTLTVGTVSDTFTITTGVGGGGTQTFVAPFTLRNWKNATSPGFHQWSHAFKKGEFPAGTIPTIDGFADADVQFTRCNFHSDGSLRKSTIWGRRATFTSLQTVSSHGYKAIAGSYNNTGTKALSDFSSLNIKMLFSAVTETPAIISESYTIASPYTYTVANASIFDNDHVVARQGNSYYTRVASSPGTFEYTVTTGGLYTFNAANVGTAMTIEYTTRVTRGSGAFTADFNTFAAVPTRCWKYDIGTVTESWKVWGFATDDAGGAPDTDLVIMFYVTLIKDGAGTIVDHKIAPRIGLFRYNSTTKKRLNYIAKLNVNGIDQYTYTAPALQTIIGTPISGLENNYHSSWMAVRTDNDANEAVPMWVTQIPTLNMKPDIAYLKETGYMPPINPNINPPGINSEYTINPYTPFSHTIFNSQGDATGASAGRAMLPFGAHDVHLFGKMIAGTVTENDYRYQRVCALSAHGLMHHMLSGATRQRPASAGCPGGDASPDIAMSTIPQLLSRTGTAVPGATAGASFTADGLPASTNAYSTSDSNYGALNDASLDWTNGGDAAHLYTYVFGNAFLEGEYYNEECLKEIANNACIRYNGSGINNLGYTNIPNYTQKDWAYGGICQLNPSSGNTPRKFGAAFSAFFQAYLLNGSNEIDYNYWNTAFAQQVEYITQTYAILPADQLAAGVLSAFNFGITKLWMQIFPQQAMCIAYKVTGLSIFYDYANFMTNINREFSVDREVTLGDYETVVTNNSDIPWHPSTNPFLTTSHFRTGSLNAHVTASTDVVRWDFIDSSPVIYYMENGDSIYPIRIGEDDFGAIPAPFVAATPYYIINRDGTTFGITSQLSVTPGGSPINFTSDTSFHFSLYNPTGGNHFTNDWPANWGQTDGTPITATPPHYWKWATGQTDLDAAIANQDTLFASQATKRNNYPSWNVHN